MWIGLALVGGVIGYMCIGMLFLKIAARKQYRQSCEWMGGVPSSLTTGEAMYTLFLWPVFPVIVLLRCLSVLLYCLCRALAKILHIPLSD